MNCNAKLAARALAIGAGLSVSLAIGCSGGGTTSATTDEEQADKIGTTDEVSSALNVASTKLWPDPVISVCFESVPSPDDRGIIRDAIRKTWELESNVHFTGWGICVAGATGIRVRSINAALAVSGTGTDINGVVNGVTIPNWATSSCYPGWSRDRCVRASAVRAFGHALGFAGEYNRADRSLLCSASQFSTQNGDTNVGDFDFQSVMSNCNTLFFGDGFLSATDIRGLQQAYGGPRTITIASWAPGRLDAFIRGMDGALYQRWWDGSNWNGFASLGGALSGPPVAVSWGPNRVDIFGRGVDGLLKHIAWTGTQWSPWETIGNVAIVGTPRVVSLGANRLDIFARGEDRSVMHIGWVPGWTAWESLGGDMVGDVEAVARVVPRAGGGSDNVLDVVARRSSDGYLMHKQWNGSIWSAHWNSLGESEGVPALVAGPPERVHLFTRNFNREILHNMLVGASWQGWVGLGGTSTSFPTATGRGANGVDVFCRGVDGSVHTRSWVGSGYTAWKLTQARTVRGAPGAVAWAHDRVDVFVRGTDDSMYQTYWQSPNPAWGSWFPLGGTFR